MFNAEAWAPLLRTICLFEWQLGCCVFNNLLIGSGDQPRLRMTLKEGTPLSLKDVNIIYIETDVINIIHQYKNFFKPIFKYFSSLGTTWISDSSSNCKFYEIQVQI